LKNAAGAIAKTGFPTFSASFTIDIETMHNSEASTLETKPHGKECGLAEAQPRNFSFGEVACQY
jgi:hypothetical protein